MFNIGANDSSQKKGPGLMLEELQARHPNAFDLPTESEIQSKITKLLKNSKTSQSDKPTQQSEHMVYLKALVDTNPIIMPKAALQQFQMHFGPTSVDIYTDDQVKRRINSIKTAWKKQHATTINVML